MKLSTSQKVARFFTSKKKFSQMEEESKKWTFTCKSCGKISNIWEIGGIRYKAKGEPKVSIKCPECGEIAMQKITKTID
ncbi:hypothetical protein K6119_11990 [Paracrocinitomix mangrovi]|uniref:hypothetical protein n=1 Tax=Paracrocinitomix mangrovi TaxID=2862509 RepID=UPI001C8D2F0A|nr:hypothetical protein [Paracrocinitomix mangrovi]UKN00452.1 hypothetical protein K6119_11990 [Paracrocinitomix mangrovi]